MKSIYDQLVDVSASDANGTLETGANQAGFIRIVQAMDDLGWFFGPRDRNFLESRIGFPIPAGFSS